MKKHNSILLGLFLFLLAAEAAWASAPALLPQEFNGWRKNPATARVGSEPSVVDATDSDVLKEYGFADFEQATFNRNGRKLEVRAARFKDASGAYGAFTYYAQPQMQPEQIGDRAVSNNSRILFYRGNILVDATLEHISAMSAADLRALARSLPRPLGNLSTLPTLPGNLPKQPRATMERYILGPVAMARLGLPVPASLVDFSKSPEVEFATYRISYSDSSLTLISYPTPQIAAERLRALQAASLPGGPIHYKRSGPLLALVSGNIPDADAEALLSQVNYDADVTWNQPARPDRNQDSGGFIMAEVLLVLTFLGIAVTFGLAFGGFRMISKRLFPKHTLDRRDEAEIIRLNLR